MFTLFALMIIIFSISYRTAYRPGIEQGHLDLGDYDYTVRPVSLGGGWSYRPGAYNQYDGAGAISGFSLSVPGSLNPLENRLHSEAITGVLSLDITGAGGEPLMLRVPAIQSASRVYVNGRLVSSSDGVELGRNRRLKDILNPTLVSVQPDQGRLRIVLEYTKSQVYYESDIREPFILGSWDALRLYYYLKFSAFTYVFLFNIFLFLMGLTLHFNRRKDNATLLLGLLGISITLFNFSSSYEIVTIFLSDATALLVIRLVLMSTALFAFSGTMFLRSALTSGYRFPGLSLFRASTGFLIILPFFIPLPIIDKLYLVYLVYAGGCALIISTVFVRAFRRREQDLLFILATLILVVVTIIGNVVLFFQRESMGQSLFNYGILFAFLAFQLFYLIRRDCNQTRELRELNETLTQRVEEKTETLREANARLEREIEERKRAEYELQELSLTDPLTELPNRRYYELMVRQEMTQAARYSHDLALIMIDIDHFKSINDTWGHSTGDEILKAAGELLQEGVRDVDILCRWGGEEFAVLLPECTGEEARALGERLRGTLEGFCFCRDISVTASFGIAVFRRGEEPEALLERADAALYEAKSGGRNQVVMRV